MEETQLALVRAAIGGDDDALAQLLEDAGHSLRAELQSDIGSRYRGLVEADDVLQVTCLEAFLRIRAFDPQRAGAFFAWLRQVSQNNLRDAIRELEREKRPPPGKRMAPPGDGSYPALIERLAITSTTPSRVAAQHEIQASVDAALRRLPPDYERVLRLYELEELSGEEVAEQMSRRPGAVRMLLARARQRLVEILCASSQFASSA